MRRVLRQTDAPIRYITDCRASRISVRYQAFQRDYAASAKSPEAWAEWRAAWVDISEDDYQRKVAAR